MAKSPTFDELYARYPTQEAGEALFALESEGQTPDEAENTLLRRVYRKSRKTGDKARYAKMLGQDEATFDTTLSKWQKARADRQVVKEGGAVTPDAKPEGAVGPFLKDTARRGVESYAGLVPAAFPLVEQVGRSEDKYNVIGAQNKVEQKVVGAAESLPGDAGKSLGQMARGGSIQQDSALDTAAQLAMQGKYAEALQVPFFASAVTGALLDFSPGPGFKAKSGMLDFGLPKDMGLTPGSIDGSVAPTNPFDHPFVEGEGFGEALPDFPREFTPETRTARGLTQAPDAELRAPSDRSINEQIQGDLFGPRPVQAAPVRKPLKRFDKAPESILPRNFQPEIEAGPRLPFSQEMGPVPSMLNPMRQMDAPRVGEISRGSAVEALPPGLRAGPTGTGYIPGTPNPARSPLAKDPRNVALYDEAVNWFQERIGARGPRESQPWPDPAQGTLPGMAESPQQMLPGGVRSEGRPFSPITRNQWLDASGRDATNGVPRGEQGTQASMRFDTVAHDLEAPRGQTPGVPRGQELGFSDFAARLMEEQGPQPKGRARAAKGTADHYQNWLKKNKLKDSGAAREEFFKSGRGAKLGGKPGSVGGASKDFPVVEGPFADSAFVKLDPSVEGVTERPGRGVPYHTAHRNDGSQVLPDIPPSRALAKVPGNQVVDSTRRGDLIAEFGEGGDNRFDGSYTKLADDYGNDSRLNVAVPYDEFGTPGKEKLNPAAFPDRLPMGDRQPGASGKVTVEGPYNKTGIMKSTDLQSGKSTLSATEQRIERPVRTEGGETSIPERPRNRFGEELDTGKMRERERASQDRLTRARALDPEAPPVTQGDLASELRVLEESGSTLKPVETPALSDLVKRESDALDDYLKRSGRYESLSGGLSLKAAHDTLESGLKKAKKFLGATPENKNVSMALDKFIGRKAFIFSSAQDVVNTAKRQGLSTKAAVEFAEQRIDKELREARKEFVTTAEKNGLNAEEANVLSRELVEFSGATPRLLKAFTRYVKTSKVLLNPMSSYVNNGVGNIGFQLMGGGQKQMLTAGSELKSSGAHYKRALKDGLFGSEFFAHNKMDFIKNLHAENAEGLVAHGMKYARKPVQGLAALYDGTDKVFKLASYIQKFEDLKKAGLSESVASREAVHHVGLFFPNYEKIGGFTGILRKSSFAPYVFNPFIAFPSESVRIYKNWVLHGGARGKTLAAALPAYLWASYQRGLLLNQDPEETKKAREDLPGYQNFGGRFNVPLYKRADGETSFLDITQWVPLLDLFSGGTMDKNKSKGENIFNLATNAVTRFAGGGLLTSEQYKASGQPGVYDSVRNFANAPSWGTAQDVTRTRVGSLLTPPIVSRFMSFGMPRKGEEEGDKIRDALAAFGIRTLTTSDATREQRDRQEDGQQTEASREAGYIQNNQNIPEEDQDALVEDILSRYE